MKECPRCGRQTSLSYRTGKAFCPSCGWGTDAPLESSRIPPRRMRHGPTTLGGVLGCWVLSAAIVGGLYYLIFILGGVERTTAHLGMVAGALIVYSAIAWVCRPTLDHEALSGTVGYLAHPSENLKLRLVRLLGPGRAVSGAVVGTYRLFTGRITLGGGRRP
ncbi:MAG: hypothetical protein JW889_15465 [Verrucomicrobia bacterium]|nr:hypothetical protein [Verrucomicrobiota bacterium]